MDPPLDKPSYATSSIVADRIYAILSTYLLNTSTDSASTAQAIVSYVESSMAPIGQVQAVKYLWATFFHLVKQLPPSSTHQDHLVNLLLQICKVRPSGGSLRANSDIYALRRYWKDLPHWRAVWAEYESGAPLVPTMALRPGAGSRVSGAAVAPWRGLPLTGHEWTNLNAFMAKMHRSSNLPYLDLKGLYALLEALEERQARETIEDLLPGAACWVLYAGEVLKNNAVPYAQGEDDGSKRLPWSVGELYSGPTGFNAERWAFWKMRFDVLKERGDLSEETRGYATRASDRMLELDENRIEGG